MISFFCDCKAFLLFFFVCLKQTKPMEPIQNEFENKKNDQKKMKINLTLILDLIQ